MHPRKSKSILVVIAFFLIIQGCQKAGNNSSLLPNSQQNAKGAESQKQTPSVDPATALSQKMAQENETAIPYDFEKNVCRIYRIRWNGKQEFRGQFFRTQNPGTHEAVSQNLRVLTAGEVRYGLTPRIAFSQGLRPIRHHILEMNDQYLRVNFSSTWLESTKSSNIYVERANRVLPLAVYRTKGSMCADLLYETEHSDFNEDTKGELDLERSLEYQILIMAIKEGDVPLPPTLQTSDIDSFMEQSRTSSQDSPSAQLHPYLYDLYDVNNWGWGDWDNKPTPRKEGQPPVVLKKIPPRFKFEEHMCRVSRLYWNEREEFRGQFFQPSVNSSEYFSHFEGLQVQTARETEQTKQVRFASDPSLDVMNGLTPETSPDFQIKGAYEWNPFDNPYDKDDDAILVLFQKGHLLPLSAYRLRGYLCNKLFYEAHRAEGRGDPSLLNLLTNQVIVMGVEKKDFSLPPSYLESESAKNLKELIAPTL